MSTVLILGTVALAASLAVVLAFGSLHLVVGFITSRVVEPVRRFVQRQRERRGSGRLGSLDRRSEVVTVATAESAAAHSRSSR